MRSFELYNAFIISEINSFIQIKLFELCWEYYIELCGNDCAIANLSWNEFQHFRVTPGANSSRSKRESVNETFFGWMKYKKKILPNLKFSQQMYVHMWCIICDTIIITRQMVVTRVLLILDLVSVLPLLHFPMFPRIFLSVYIR